MSPEHSEGDWTLQGGHQGKSLPLWGADPCNCELPSEQRRGGPGKGKLDWLVGDEGAAFGTWDFSKRG